MFPSDQVGGNGAAPGFLHQPAKTPQGPCGLRETIVMALVRWRLKAEPRNRHSSHTTAITHFVALGRSLSSSELTYKIRM
jgi:hypothetical protein